MRVYIAVRVAATGGNMEVANDFVYPDHSLNAAAFPPLGIQLRAVSFPFALFNV